MKQFLKRRWKEILASSVMVISMSILTFQLLAPSKKIEIKPYEISNMGEYYKKLDEDSQEHIRNNIFSVTYFPKSTRGLSASIYGTCWSFYHDDNFWYLMTNHHVIEDIHEQAFWSSYDPANNQMRYSRPGRYLYDAKTNGIVGREVYYDDSMEFKSDLNEDKQIKITAENANIIYTRLSDLKYSNQEAKRIFADVDLKHSKRFQVDMALIKVAYDSLEISQKTKDGEKTYIDPVDWIKQNTYSFDEEYDQLNDKLPAKLNGDNTQQSFYYTAGYPAPSGAGRSYFIDGILNGGITEKAGSMSYTSSLPFRIKRASNSWQTISPFAESEANSLTPKGWKMSGGSSGSPLLEVEQDKKSGKYYLKRKTPVAIYWGGTGIQMDNTELFYPTFDLLYNDQSDRDVMSYNILQNCHAFLKSSKTSSESLN